MQQWRKGVKIRIIVATKDFIFTSYVFIYFVCTFYINILGNKIDLELPSGLVWHKFVKSHHATLVTGFAFDL